MRRKTGKHPTSIPQVPGISAKKADLFSFFLSLRRLETRKAMISGYDVFDECSGRTQEVDHQILVEEQRAYQEGNQGVGSLVVGLAYLEGTAWEDVPLTEHPLR